MSTISLPTTEIAQRRPAAARTSPADPMPTESSTASRFGLIFVAVALVALLLAGWCPLGFSIVTVFLFAGPHNWLEGRYFVSRMPARWGPLRVYYLTGIAGVLALTGAFALLPVCDTRFQWSGETWLAAIAAWNTALVAWIWLLAHQRSGQNPRRNWSGVAPAGLSLIALAWLKPLAWDLGLVYLHPLVALCFLDRELAIHRPAWQRTYRRLLVALPLVLAGLWWHLADAPPLPGSDALSARITAHAGAEILTGVSSHLLVATHTFLEMLHYGVWLVAIPLVSVRTLPLAHDRGPARPAVAGVARGHRRPAGRRWIGGHRLLGWLSGRLSTHPRCLFHGRHAARAGRGPLPAAAALRCPTAHDPRRSVAFSADRIPGHRTGRDADLVPGPFGRRTRGERA